MVYLVEYFWYGTYELLGVYDNKEAALAHIKDPNCIKEYGDELTITGVGVRSRKQLKPVCKVDVCTTNMSS
jgi:hypothetical protein